LSVRPEIAKLFVIVDVQDCELQILEALEGFVLVDVVLAMEIEAAGDFWVILSVKASSLGFATRTDTHEFRIIALLCADDSFVLIQLRLGGVARQILLGAIHSIVKCKCHSLCHN
jgi:hypothetical protein